MLCKVLLFSERDACEGKQMIYSLTAFKMLFYRYLQFVLSDKAIEFYK